MIPINTLNSPNILPQSTAYQDWIEEFLSNMPAPPGPHWGSPASMPARWRSWTTLCALLGHRCCLYCKICHWPAEQCQTWDRFERPVWGCSAHTSLTWATWLGRPDSDCRMLEYAWTIRWPSAVKLWFLRTDLPIWWCWLASSSLQVGCLIACQRSQGQKQISETLRTMLKCPAEEAWRTWCCAEWACPASEPLKDGQTPSSSWEESRTSCW